jgi:tetratricopeptide (TPR) repeat protein
MLLSSLRLLGEDQKPSVTKELSKEPLNLTSIPEIPVDAAARKLIDEAIRQKDLLSAENQLVKLIEQNPNSPQLLALFGRVLFMDGKYLNSAVAFKKAERITPLKEEDRFTVAMTFVILKRRDWARMELDKLIQANQKSPRYPYWLARLDYDETRYADAVVKLKKALELDPDFMRAYDNLGLCYEALGEFEQACKSYEKANQLNRAQGLKSAWPPLNLGTLLLGRGGGSEAEAYLREAVSCDPKLPQARLQLGTLLEKQMKYREAIQELNEATTLDPSYPEPHYALARIYRTTGDLKSAEMAAKTFQALKQKKQEAR